MKRRGLLPFLAVALAVAALDQITKQLIVTHLGPFEVIEVTSFFTIVYVENTGSAFGMFRSLGNAFFIAAAVLAILFIGWLMVKDSDHRLILSLVLGGAAGNLIDRIRYGHVVDFLDFHIGGVHWPAFNVADSALTIGVTLLIITMLFPPSRKR